MPVFNPSAELGELQLVRGVKAPHSLMESNKELVTEIREAAWQIELNCRRQGQKVDSPIRQEVISWGCFKFKKPVEFMVALKEEMTGSPASSLAIRKYEVAIASKN